MEDASIVPPEADFEIFRAMWALGMLPNDVLPAAGVSALNAGVDSEESRMLAGLERYDTAKAPILFETIVKQFDRPSVEESAMIYARAIARCILAGSIDPVLGARAIWLAAEKVNGQHDFHTLDGFIYAASEYEDRPRDREFFVKAIENEARSLIVRLAVGS